MAAMPLQGPKRPSFLPEVKENFREGLRRRGPETLDHYDSANTTLSLVFVVFIAYGSES